MKYVTYKFWSYKLCTVYKLLVKVKNIPTKLYHPQDRSWLKGINKRTDFFQTVYILYAFGWFFKNDTSLWVLSIVHIQRVQQRGQEHKKLVLSQCNKFTYKNVDSKKRLQGKVGSLLPTSKSWNNQKQNNLRNINDFLILLARIDLFNRIPLYVLTA